MAMRHYGLVKLSEDCAEVVQVAQKMIAYPKLIFGAKLHPDGSNLRTRLVEEIGDTCAALDFVIDRLKLSRKLIEERAAKKRAWFEEWDKEP